VNAPPVRFGQALVGTVVFIDQVPHLVVDQTKTQVLSPVARSIPDAYLPTRLDVRAPMYSRPVDKA
jgi:hypothetical protein